MIKETISKILKKILDKEVSFDYAYFSFEETKGHYKNIYKIIASDKTYVLKKAKGNELDIYSFINNSVAFLPYYYGSFHYYNSDYILFDYIDGHNLMKTDKKSLRKVIDAVIALQKKYWASSSLFGTPLDEAIKQRENRLSCLPEELKKTYEEYIDCFKKTPVTFSHEDLLPFNVLINQKHAYFFDLEVGGILPYPTMLARLISHTKEDKNALFHLKKEDYQFAISYYFDNFIKQQGISYQEYTKTMNLFVFNELIEWIYVYKKNNYQPNNFYNDYYQKAIMKIEEIKGAK